MDRDKGLISDVGIAMFGLLVGFGFFVIVGLSSLTYVIRSVAQVY